MTKKVKKHFGDRRDATLVKKLDSMHVIMPLVFPNRCDNEAFISEKIDLTNLNEWLKEKNSTNPELKYTLFQTVVTAIMKTIILRPKMNRFYKGISLYQRNDVTAAFVIKVQFDDEAEEALVIIRADEDDTLEGIRTKIQDYIAKCRNGKKDDTTEQMDFLSKLPRFVLKMVGAVVRFLDVRGMVPASLIKTDLYHSSVILSNLGSIKLKSGYHHLSNWGTTSVFCIIGEKKMSPFFDADGNVTMRETVELGLTVDERIADGYYFSKTIRIFKKLLENPELLENKLSEEVDC